ncbi:glycoside hydrolase family 43 protein [Fulvivirga ligni]|uniref:glycoside hydrolase family 43 protein n=1 Tax=Fulvivirga ligni TaxID=2904246 RepID=UPI001F43E8FE|nr:glycoside hydrolase family 43 protein [Fulvivirga ligni]UII23441.1 glycoside hydrolase family 43 protein [Fulvivirga ligni]
MKNLHTLTIIATLILSGCQNNNETQEEIDKPSTDSVAAYNPVFKDIYTADPAAMVHDGTLYLYTGHDEQAVGAQGFLMNDWLLFSTKDMVNWEKHGPILKTTDFKWANGQAWASHVVEKEGKFYWYVTLEHASVPGKSIGVAVADSPAGPFKDAIGKALITNDMTKQTDIGWDDIDPAVFADDDGQAYIYWGNTVCKWAKLKDNMIELEGEIHTIDLPSFTEAPWVHKRGDHYYLSFAAQFPEVIDYAMATSPEGPWEYKGRLNDLVPHSPTNHQAILEFNDRWYFIYHNGLLPQGGEFRRSVCIENLYYNEDGTIQKIVQTKEGASDELD